MPCCGVARFSPMANARLPAERLITQDRASTLQRVAARGVVWMLEEYEPQPRELLAYEAGCVDASWSSASDGAGLLGMPPLGS